MKIKTIASFFAGVGGIDFAFEQLKNYKVIYANEFDKNARKTYESNFIIKVDPRDIRDVDIKEIPKTDILLAGFPCQAFSVAGYRKGFEDHRGDLFFETLKIIVENKPEIVFLENVKNLVTHDEGNTFKIIREGLEQNGYYLKGAVLNSKDYANIPQNRERIYIIAFRSKSAFDNFEFPEPIELTKSLKEVIGFSDKVKSKYYYTEEKNPIIYKELEKKIQRKKKIYIIAFHYNSAYDNFEFPEQIELTKSLKEVIGCSYKVKSKYYNTEEKNPNLYKELEKKILSQKTIYQWRRQYVRENKNGVVPTLTANMGTGGHNVPLILSDMGIRKLTPRETFNIQGYPKSFVLPKDVADGQLYKQAGNSVVVPMVNRIAKKIQEALEFINDEAEEYIYRNETVTYTNMFGSNRGESYVIRNSEKQKFITQGKNEDLIPLITTDQYKKIIKQKKWKQFYMMNE